jgi:hypothetical protein
MTAQRAPASASAHPRRQRVALAPDFLSLPPELVSVAVSARGGRPSSGPSTAPHTGGRALTQMEQDEQLAMMLQNEGFVDSLAADPEFAAYLRANPSAAAALGIPVPAHVPGAGRQAQRVQAGGAARPPAPTASTRSAASGSLSSSGRIVGLSGGSPPQAAASGGGDILGAMTSMGADMRRRFDAVAARFRRSNVASSGAGWSTSAAGGGAAAAPTSGGGLLGLFDRSGGRAAYAQVPSGGGEGEARVGGYRDEEEEKDVEIELTGADSFDPTFPEHPKGGGGAEGSSFAIDDEEEDSRSSLAASFGASSGGAGGRGPKHV